MRPSVPELSLIYDESPHSPVQPSPQWQPNRDDVFHPHSAPKSQIPSHHLHQHHQQENLPRQRNCKPGYDDRMRRRPGPLRDIDQNSPHSVGMKVRSQSNSSRKESQTRRRRGGSDSSNKLNSPSGIPRHSSEPAILEQEMPNIVEGRKNSSPHPQVMAIQNATSPIGQDLVRKQASANQKLSNLKKHQQVIARQNMTAPPIGQGHANLPVSANHMLPDRFVNDNQNKSGTDVQNNNFKQQDVFRRTSPDLDQRRTSAPLPRQYEPTNLIGQNMHQRQSLPNGVTPYICPQPHPQSNAQSGQMALPSTANSPIHKLPNHHTQSEGVQHIQRSELHPQQSTIESDKSNESTRTQSLPTQNLPDTVSPSRKHDNPRGTGVQIVSGRPDSTNENSSGGASGLASHEAYEQLKRQEQMIRELQAQVC